MKKVQSNNIEVLELLSKRINIDDEIINYNHMANVLSNCLEGKQLNKMVDFMQTKQDELGKKRVNMISVKLSQHLDFAMRRMR